MYGYLQQERGYLYQGVQGAVAQGCAHGLYSGSYAQIKIPKFEMDYNKDIDKDLIGAEYLPAWEKFGLFGLKCKNEEETIRAYSMANYPAEGDVFMLTVRIATPPFKPDRSGFMDVMPGIASSYILYPETG